jgi:hypothetical protein
MMKAYQIAPPIKVSGMVSAQTLAAFETMDPPVHYIVGVRM